MGSILSISVKNSKELLAAVLAIKAVDSTTRKQIRDHTASEISPEWSTSLASASKTDLDRAVLADTARVRVSDQNVALQSATVGKKLRGGLNPKIDYPAIEFGADRNKVTAYKRRTRHGETTVTRHTRHQLPPITRKGRVVYPTASQFIPRYASLWVQTVVKTIYDAFEGKAS